MIIIGSIIRLQSFDSNDIGSNSSDLANEKPQPSQLSSAKEVRRKMLSAYNMCKFWDFLFRSTQRSDLVDLKFGSTKLVISIWN